MSALVESRYDDSGRSKRVRKRVIDHENVFGVVGNLPVNACVLYPFRQERRKRKVEERSVRLDRYLSD